jgi:hypothetical protein
MSKRKKSVETFPIKTGVQMIPAVSIGEMLFALLLLRQFYLPFP